MAQHEQPTPVPGKEERVASLQQDVTPALIDRIRQRAAAGLETYGRPLQTFNGRDGLQDALEEGLDLCQYLQQVFLERQSMRYRRVKIVSPAVCFNCHGLFLADEEKPQEMILDDDQEEGIVALFCGLNCAALQEDDLGRLVEKKPHVPDVAPMVPQTQSGADYLGAWCLPRFTVYCKREGCLKVLGSNIQAVITPAGSYYCTPEHAGISHCYVAPLSMQTAPNLEHVDAGPWVKSNGGLSSILRGCVVCGQSYDPTWASGRRGCCGY